MTERLPACSSVRRKSRPSAGPIPRTRKKSADTAIPSIRFAGAFAMPSVNEFPCHEAMLSKLFARARQSEKFGYEVPFGIVAGPPLPDLSLVNVSNATIRSGCGNGSGRSSTASTSENTAVAAPMPSASVIVAMTVKPMLLRSCRRANRMSCTRLYMSYLSPLVCIYSVRSASIGSTFAARWAGTSAATIATSATRAITIANVIGSNVETPKS